VFNRNSDNRVAEAEMLFSLGLMLVACATSRVGRLNPNFVATQHRESVARIMGALGRVTFPSAIERLQRLQERMHEAAVGMGLSEGQSAPQILQVRPISLHIRQRVAGAAVPLFLPACLFGRPWRDGSPIFLPGGE
jgi:hypothetical protein